MTTQYSSVPGQYNYASQSYNIPNNITGAGPAVPKGYVPYSSGGQSYISPNMTQQTQTGGSTGGGSVSGQTGTDPNTAIKNTISGGWDSYIGSLNDILNGLTGQKDSQNSTIESQYNSGAGDLGLQKTQGDQALNTQTDRVNQNQSKNLLSLADQIRNGFQSGNVFLGSQGAGDSSAANQYSYALTKLGSKGRTDIVNNTANILSDIEGRKTNLMNIYNNEMNKLSNSKNQAINSVAQWFAQQQAQIQSQIGQAGLGKSQDMASLSQNVLNHALSQLNTINQSTTGQQSALQNWAKEVGSQIQTASQGLQSQSNTNYSLPQAGQLVGSPQLAANGGIVVPAGYGGSSSNDKQNTTPLFTFA